MYPFKNVSFTITTNCKSHTHNIKEIHLINRFIQPTKSWKHHCVSTVIKVICHQISKVLNQQWYAIVLWGLKFWSWKKILQLLNVFSCLPCINCWRQENTSFLPHNAKMKRGQKTLKNLPEFYGNATLLKRHVFQPVEL